MNRRCIILFITCLLSAALLVSCHIAANPDSATDGEATSAESRMEDSDQEIPAIEPLTDELLHEIVTAFREGLPEEERGGAEEVSLRYYGRYGDAYVMFVDSSVYMYYDMEETVKVGGFSFEYRDSHHLEVYYEGDFYTVSEAFNLGILSEDDLRLLHARYTYGDPVRASVSGDSTQ